MSSLQTLHIAGWNTCSFYKKASQVLTSIAILFPSRVKVVDHCFNSRNEYREWLIDGTDGKDAFRKCIPDARAAKHTSSPFVWKASDVAIPPTTSSVTGFIGGHDDTMSWCRAFCAPGGDGSMKTSIPSAASDGYDPNHTFDYDLVVLGGGSGGLAASKEAIKVGGANLRVAVLDFVQPSPQGTTWGLGGTCVNVGCIPKKLMHAASILRETIHTDAAPFGIDLSKDKGGCCGGDGGGPVEAKHSWEKMRENIQNHIKGLNFKYRVALREGGVTYLNKLGQFKDKHTMNVTDKKGRTSEITAARFIIAVGGRPSPLDCEGGELALSSDDIFSLEKSPGKTLCVGASYISLECAGFLNGLGHDTTVAVRSILLRGFDRECAEKIGEHMEEKGITFLKGVVPKKLQKVGSAIKVTFSDGNTETYDTVLAAVGRTGDTTKIGLDKAGVKVNPKNGKILTVHERAQGDSPHVYAVGDVMEGCPELTPVAIGAGTALARRLFGGSDAPMDYRNICTTVFTPVEYGCVGFSEEDASDEFGSCNIEVYHKSFLPLEWALASEAGSGVGSGFCKCVVSKSDGKVLGMHYVGPNAGEVMQGFAVAVKQGLMFDELSDTVGIHPTCAEEMVTMTVTKSSGEDATAAGC